MPTLADKINKNKSILKTGDGLFEQTGESIMSRIQKRGMPAGAGASPMAAAGLGVSPDQAKMAGTAAQMGSVIRESTAPREGERRPQERMFETEEEKQAKQKAQKLSNLELLGSRIGGIVNTAIQGARPVDVTTLSYVQPDILKGDFRNLTDDQLSGVSASIAKITYDDEGNPIFPVGLLEEVNAQLPEDQRFTSNEELVKYTRQGTPSLKLNNTKIKETYPDITDEQLASLEAVLSSTGVLDGKDVASLDADDLNNIANLFGITGETLDTIIAKINEFIIPVTDTVIDNITGAVGPTVALADFTTEDWQAFGLEGPADLVNLLGITEAEASTLTVGELQKKVNALLEADYDRVDELTRVANDPFYPESLRKAAQAELRNLSSVGVVATESDFNKLNEAVQSADMIEVAGKTYTVDELLSDEQLTVLISSYLEDPESDYSKDLLKDFPALVEFINDNKAALENAMQYLDESIKDKIAISKKNDELNKYSPEEGVDIDLTGVNQAVLGEDFEEGLFSDTQMSEGEFTIGEGDDAITYYYQENIRSSASEFSGPERAEYARLIADSQKNGYNDYFKEIATMDSRAIIDAAKAAGITTTQWLNRKYTRAINNKTIDDALSLQTASDSDYQQVMKNVIGMDVEDIKSLVKSYDILTAYSLGGTSSELDLLRESIVTDAKGNINYPATLNKFKTINNGNIALKNDSISAWASAQSASLKSKNYSDLYSALNDGYLSSSEVDTILSLNDNRQIDKLIDIVQHKRKDAGLRQAGGLSFAVDEYIGKKYSEYIKGSFEDSGDLNTAIRLSSGLVSFRPTAYDVSRGKALLTKFNKLYNSAMGSAPFYITNKLKEAINNLKTELTRVEPAFNKSQAKRAEERRDEDWDRYEAGQRGGVD